MSEITDDEMSKVLIFVNKILSKSEDMLKDCITVPSSFVVSAQRQYAN
jgi:hypothetical protein